MSGRLASRSHFRWLLVVLAAAAMGAAGTYQFVWSSIRPVLGARLAASETSLGVVFSVFVVAQTLSQFPAGRFRDRRGPRVPFAVGTVLLAAGYVGIAFSTTAWHAALAYGLGGVGAGFLYTVAVNTPVKWFDARRGLATGLVTMGYGGTSVLFIPPVRRGLAVDFTGTLLALAGVTGGICALGALFLRDPDQSASTTELEDDGPATDGSGYGWRDVVRTWQFWLLYLVFVVVNGVGLMLIGKVVTYATALDLSPAVATASASFIALTDSAGIVVVGALSDHVGRERTVSATITVCGLAIGAAVWAGQQGYGWLFVGLLGAATFFRSPIFAIGPAIVGDYYGRARSSENYATLYTSKLWGGLGGGVVASFLVAAAGWSTVFLGGAVLMTVAGLLLGLLRPVD